jgi:hypothetical protein
MVDEPDHQQITIGGFCVDGELSARTVVDPQLLATDGGSEQEQQGDR